MAESTSFTPIQVYHSETVEAVPAALNLQVGELALNIVDRKLYTKDSANNIVEITNSGDHTHSIIDISDIDFSGLTDGDIIYYDSSTESWVVGSAGDTITISEISDVDLTGIGDGDVLIYDSSTETWITADGAFLPPGGTADQVLAKVDGTDYNVYWKDDAGTTLSSIGDVDLTGLTDGDTIVYDSSTSTWVAGDGDGLGDVGTHRYWRIGFGAKNDSGSPTTAAQVSDVVLFENGRGFWRGQRWLKGNAISLTAGMITDFEAAGGGSPGGSGWSVIAGGDGVTVSFGVADGDSRSGPQIDFGEGNEKAISGIDCNGRTSGISQTIDTVEFSYSDDGVNWVVASTVRDIQERAGVDAVPSGDIPHIGNIGSSETTGADTLFDLTVPTIPRVDTSGGGGTTPADPYWDFDTTVKTSGFTAEAGKYYFLDRGGFGATTYTVALPASPTAGDRVGFAVTYTGADYPARAGASDYNMNRWDLQDGGIAQLSLGYSNPGSFGGGEIIMHAEVIYIESAWRIFNIERSEMFGS